MESGACLTGNRSENGGGVHVTGGGTFTMNDGIISDNTATLQGGGGVYVDTFLDNDTWNYIDGTFTMNGGTISKNKSIGDNSAYGYGGGVYVDTSTPSKFNKIKSDSGSGTIYGKNDPEDDDPDQNIVDQYDGHAVYVNNSYPERKRNTTADSSVELHWSEGIGTGDWD
ncbi:MAG: hypothetical protein LBT00_04930 [Spirochaetaceae bacterium]|jgi:hypothetical protein|nr:hypothetical protein [Spirochaetaceae bacterium]